MEIIKSFLSIFSGSRQYKKSRRHKKRNNKSRRRNYKSRKMRGGWGEFMPEGIYIKNKEDIQKGGWGGAINTVTNM